MPHPSPDGGRQVLKFVDRLAQLTRDGALDEAVALLRGATSFTESNIWTLPYAEREVLSVPKRERNFNTLALMKHRAPKTWLLATGARAHAVWPELAIKWNRVEISRLADLPRGRFDQLKLAYILTAAEELIHAVQFSRADFFVTLSRHMAKLGRTSIPPVSAWGDENPGPLVGRGQAWAEEDVYAYLLETFGPDVVPPYFAGHYVNWRWNLFRAYYPNHELKTLWPHSTPAEVVIIRKQMIHAGIGDCAAALGEAPRSESLPPRQ